MTSLRFTVAIVLLLLPSTVHSARPDIFAGAGAPFFGGIGGGVTPTPPIGKAPYDPALILGTGGGPIVLSVLAPTQRVVILRRLDGSMWHVSSTDSEGHLLLAVPAAGALIDILGSDVIGLPIAPWQRITVHLDGLAP